MIDIRHLIGHQDSSSSKHSEPSPLTDIKSHARVEIRNLNWLPWIINEVENGKSKLDFPSPATISLGVLRYDWPDCKYLANESVRKTKTTPRVLVDTGAFIHMQIVFEILYSEYSTLKFLFEQNQTKLLQKVKSTTTEIFYNIREIFQHLFYHILLQY